MTTIPTDYSVDRLEDDGGRPRAGRDGEAPRLAWAPVVEGQPVAGAWWPRSRDAVSEVGSLVGPVGLHVHRRVTRVSLNIDAWGPTQPRRLRVDDSLVRLGWFHHLDPATVTLGCGTFDRVTLAVIPPDVDAATGRELLRRPVVDGEPSADSFHGQVRHEEEGAP